MNNINISSISTNTMGLCALQVHLRPGGVACSTHNRHLYYSQVMVNQQA
jgi:hypothetical protein